MKYLVDYLQALDDGPDLADPSLQQLLHDVQASKGQARAADAFYENLEKIVNELKSSPEAAAFQKPVSKREAPDYYEVIKRPMDLATVLKNVKSHKYKSKAEFAADVDLIWENCFTYNTQETHPLRACARYMKQKADHHLEFLADKNDKSSNQILPLLPTASSSARRADSAAPTAGVEGDADDQVTGREQFFRGQDGEGHREGTPGSGRFFRGRSGSRGGRDTSVPGGGRFRPNGLGRSPPPPRPKLQTSLEASPALLRTPQAMNQFLPFSLAHPPSGPSYAEKGKARETLASTAAPSWYTVEDAEGDNLEGGWWGVMARDESFGNAIPSVPFMPCGEAVLRRKRVPLHRKRKRPVVDIPLPNGNHSHSPPTKVVDLEDVVYRTVDRLTSARKVMNQIQDFQRVEAEGGVLPPIIRPGMEEEERRRDREERQEMRRKRREERAEAKARRKQGGEIGEEEAVKGMRKGVAAMLAHNGFEGANEIALDMMTRVAIDHMRNVGRTFRLLLDSFSQKMSPEELVLHALHEQGQLQIQDLEAHIKDDIEREGGKVKEMVRKIKQAYREVTTAPVIEDDMMFNENGEMLLDGNFADELGEDFLGLRDLGIDKEFGLSSLTVPSSVFYGRRKRAGHAAALGEKVDEPDYPPPMPLIPLNPNTLHNHLPALLHAFYAARAESGLGLASDDAFDPAHAAIGSLGQIVVKSQGGGGGGGGAAKKRKEVVSEKTVNGDTGDGVDGEVKKLKKPKKAAQPGVGKGNWIRPSKEEKARRAAAKQAASQGANGMMVNGGVGGSPGSEDAPGEEEDAEGEEE